LQPFGRGPPEAITVGHLCFSPDRKILAWTNNRGIIRVWDLARNRLLPSPGQAISRIQGLAFFPDSKRVLFLNPQQVAAVWDVTENRKTASFPVGVEGGSANSYSLHVSLSPDGRWLATSSPTGRGVNLWEVETGRLLVPLPEEKGTVWCLAWSPDGQRLAVSRSDGGLAVWDCARVRRQLTELQAGW
jgi:WD40 repeat protein